MVIIMTGMTNSRPRGGIELNFSVVGGTAQPTGSENMIWVNTATAVTGWVFSATQPTGAAGLLWFKTGTSSAASFNAIRDNDLFVYPLACQQYVSGAWTTKVAKTYQNGAWEDWVEYLFNQGDGQENWVGVAGQNTSYTIGDTLKVYVMGATSTSAITSKTALDLSEKTKLTVVVSDIHNPYQLQNGMFINIGTAQYGSNAAYRNVTAVGNIEIDLSGLNGTAYYITLIASTPGSLEYDFTCSKIFIE